MVFADCTYDPLRDSSPVEQFGFIDLVTAYDNHNVPSQLPGSDTDYNGMDEPDMILGKPRDVFEMLDMDKRIAEYSPEGSKDVESKD